MPRRVLKVFGFCIKLACIWLIDIWLTDSYALSQLLIPSNMMLMECGRFAYARSFALAQSVGVSTFGLCLLSAGVFRGDRSLEPIIEIALSTGAQCVYQVPVYRKKITKYVRRGVKNLQGINREAKRVASLSPVQMLCL